MKDLLIVGASGCGRETYCLALACKGYGTEFKVKGFLDSRKHALDGYNGYPPIICAVEDYKIQPTDLFVIALGDSIPRKKYFDLVKSRGGEFLSLIHPAAIICQNAMIGEGAVISQFVTVSCDVKIGSNVKIQSYADLGHDVIIGDNATIRAQTFFGGFSEIGENSTINTGAKILPHKKVGNNSIVGAGSIVVKNVRDDKTVFGNPAKVMEL